MERAQVVIELKIKHRESSREKGAEQVADYMDKTGAEGYLVLLPEIQQNHGTKRFLKNLST